MRAEYFFSIFSEKDLSKVFDDLLREMKEEISNKPENYILNVNKTEFITYLVANYSIDNLDFHDENIAVTKYETQIPAEMFPGRGFAFLVKPGESYKMEVIRYHIPFSGNAELIKCNPSRLLLMTEKVIISDNCVCFDIINFYDNPEKIKQRANEIISLIKSQLRNVRDQVNKFNDSLQEHATNYFQKRKERLLKANDLLSSLGVSIKRQDNVPSTFSVSSPSMQKRINLSPPIVNENGFKPEPTIDTKTYKDILQIIHDAGKQFERMPSTYRDKPEESLRDHILLLLEPHFSGSATGETFNKKGKTDILLRYENSNVFIAECKFWRGEKAYLETIDQLLNYLTWRDSKSAIILFVKNKDFSSVIETVKTKTQNHSNYLGFSDIQDETWLNFRLHINDDPNREVKMAVLLFHIPAT